MAWDFAIDEKTGDLTGGYAAGQDEIVQRVRTRVLRHHGEWFVNTDAGLPWYEGPSDLLPGETSRAAAILGGAPLRRADNWIRNEIAETEGVLRVVDFHAAFNAADRLHAVRAALATAYGLPYLFTLDAGSGAGAKTAP